MLRRVLPALLAAAVLAAGCGDGTGGASGASVTAVATTTQVGDLVAKVGGKRVQVHTLLRPNADPHEYEPRPSDARAVAGSDVVFRSGGDLDGWLDDVLDNAGGDARQVTLIDFVRRRGDDPHWWQDPRNSVLAVNAIRDALGKADPGGRPTYRRRARAYADELRRLDRSIAACVARVPPRQRTLVTSHDALQYYAHRYGIKVVGALIPSLSTQAQPSARDIRRLVDQIREQHVKAIFPESALNPKLERAVSREAGAKVGGVLWADALGPKGSSGHTYVQALESNTQTLVEGMSGGAVSCRPRP
jgi:zinc/manganese transport system substrate-binding protein